jgi:hypothetical protein
MYACVDGTRGIIVGMDNLSVFVLGLKLGETRSANRRQGLFLLEHHLSLSSSFSLKSPNLNNSPNHTVHQVKENVLLLSEEECQYSSPCSPLPLSFPHPSFLSPFSSFHTGEAPDPGGATGHTARSRHRHVSPLLSLQPLPPP